MTAGWSHIVAANAAPDGGYVLSYSQNSGEYAVARVTSSSVYATRQVRSGMSRAWTQMVPAGQTYVLFYDEESGDMELTEYVSTSRDDPSGVVRSVWSSALSRGRSLVGVDNGLLLTSFQQDASGARCETLGVRESMVDKSGAVVLRAGRDVTPMSTAPIVSLGYTHIVGIGGLP